MWKFTILITYVILLISCGNIQKTDNKKASVPGKFNTFLVEHNSHDTKDWTDSLLSRYINQSENDLIKSAQKDSFQIEWFFDRVENTDSVKFLIYQIGHSFENKFITDEWLYIDSLTKKVYEYDLANDKIIRWSK